MAKHIIRLFTPSGSQTILVFFLYEVMQQYLDSPLMAASHAVGMTK